MDVEVKLSSCPALVGHRRGDRPPVRLEGRRLSLPPRVERLDSLGGDQRLKRGRNVVAQADLPIEDIQV